MRLVITSFLFILIVGSCQENFGDLITYESIAGEVLDEITLLPISGAKITTNPITDLKFSDENGRFTLDSLASQIYSVRVVVDGYVSKLSSFNLDDIESSDLLILLEKDSIVEVAPSAPVQPSPLNNALEQEINVTLSWSADNSENTGLYTVYFFRPDMVEAEVLITESADTSVLVQNLEFNSNYFWQVEAISSDGQSTRGPVWSFMTQGFPDELFRFAFNRKVDGFDQIFLGTSEREEVKISKMQANQWRPTFSPQRDKIAFLSITNGDVHLFSIDRNGENPKQISSSRPLRTKDFLEAPFAWAEEGSRLIYMDFDRIVSINRDGSGLFEYSFDAGDEIITSLDYSDLEGGRIIVTTERPSSKVSKLFLYEISEQITTRLVDSLQGQISHAQFSPSGREIIYSFNKAEEFSTSGIPLNQRLYHLNLLEGQPSDLSEGKRGGTADANPRFALNGDFVAFNNSQSDGIGGSITFLANLAETSGVENRDTLFTNAILIDWE